MLPLDNCILYPLLSRLLVFIDGTSSTNLFQLLIVNLLEIDFEHRTFVYPLIFHLLRAIRDVKFPMSESICADLWRNVAISSVSTLWTTFDWRSILIHGFIKWKQPRFVFLINHTIRIGCFYLLIWRRYVLWRPHCWSGCVHVVFRGPQVSKICVKLCRKLNKTCVARVLFNSQELSA